MLIEFEFLVAATYSLARLRDLAGWGRMPLGVFSMSASVTQVMELSTACHHEKYGVRMFRSIAEHDNRQKKNTVLRSENMCHVVTRNEPVHE